MKIYIVTKQFEISSCHSGRSTVNPGAMFCKMDDGRIYFINSNSYLPFDITGDFLKSNTYEIYNAFNEKHATLKENITIAFENCKG